MLFRIFCVSCFISWCWLTFSLLMWWFMQGIQSDNGSLLYYLPGYNPYENFMGVDGQQPYFSSSGYFQSPVSYGWDSTYGGDLKNGTRATRGGMKSANGSNIPVKSNGFNSINTSKTVDSKNSTLPSDMKSRQSTPSSNYSKPILQTQPLKPLNKVRLYPYDLTPGFIE